ncbi:MAG: hypothetical protein ABFD10_08090 [Prolixibacteraceae bacterium]
MKQKLIWMHFLLIGIISFSIFSLSSCKGDTDYCLNTTWIYINQTSHVITFNTQGFWTDFNVAAFSTTKVIEHSESSKDIIVESIVPTLNPSTVVIDGTKCDAELAVKLHDISSYEAKKIDDRTYEFTFRYTEENTSDAVNCN